MNNNQMRIETNDNENLNHAFDIILQEIQVLKCNYDSCKLQLAKQEKELVEHKSRLEKQEKELIQHKSNLNDVTNKLNDLQLKILIKEAKVNGYETTRLFKFYFVEPVIKKKYPNLETWNKFIDQWSQKEDDVLQLLNVKRTEVHSERVQSHPLIVNFLESIEKVIKESTGFTISLLQLRQLSNERHNIVHEDLRSVEEQRLFIQKIKAEYFPDEYEHSSLIKTMIDLLEGLDLDSTATKLKTLRYR